VPDERIRQTPDGWWVTVDGFIASPVMSAKQARQLYRRLKRLNGDGVELWSGHTLTTQS
jgi:hypothetical protein